MTVLGPLIEASNPFIRPGPLEIISVFLGPLDEELSDSMKFWASHQPLISLSLSLNIFYPDKSLAMVHFTIVNR